MKKCDFNQKKPGIIDLILGWEVDGWDTFMSPILFQYLDGNLF